MAEGLLDLIFAFLSGLIDKLPEWNISFSAIATVTTAVSWLWIFLDVDYIWTVASYMLTAEGLVMAARYFAWAWRRVVK